MNKVELLRPNGFYLVTLESGIREVFKTDSPTDAIRQMRRMYPGARRSGFVLVNR